MPGVLVSNDLLVAQGTLSRREFFKAMAAVMTVGTLLSAGAQLPLVVPAAFARATADPHADRLLAGAATLARSAFTPYVGGIFQLRRALPGAVSLELVKVRDLLAAPRLAMRGQSIDPEQSFSLLFRGPLDRPLGQDVYRLAHARTGDVELMLVPMRPEHDGRYYEVVFNRVREEPAR